MIRFRNHLLVAAVLTLAAACSGTARPAASAPAEPAIIPAWLVARRDQQIAAATGTPAFHDFSFADRLAASGITFENRVVDDAGKDYKKVHYDHGTGIAAADVDGDGLPDLYFVSQLGTGELWRNLGGGRFGDLTDSAGLRMPDAIAVAAAFADIDNDGDPDLFVTTVRHGNRLFENEGGGRFRDITAQAGVGYVGHSSGAVFFDYDGDGRLDLLVTNVGRYTTEAQGRGGYFVGLPDAFQGHVYPDRTETSILYRNLGGNRFVDVSRSTGLVDTGWSGDATIVDVNDDGRPDVYILNMQGSDHLWLNQGGSRFRDATAKYFPETPWGAMGVKSFDFDGDGRLDLFITDMHSDMWVNVRPDDLASEHRKADSAPMSPAFFPGGKRGYIFGNALFANRGGGRYTDVSDSVGVENYWPWGPSVDDLNADGWDDIFIGSSMNFPHRYGINSVLLNEQGRHFLRSEFLLGIEPRAGGVTEKVWFVLDCNGADRPNPFCAACLQPGPKAEECRGMDGQGRLALKGTLGTRSAVMLDLEGDGDLDIVTNEFNAPPQVLVSDLTARHQVRSLKIQLHGTVSNRQGIGAVVTVALPDGRKVVKVVDGKSGYLSQSDLPLYFGLGEADHAAGIEVRWPSGKRQSMVGPVTAGQTVAVTEP